MAVSTLHSQNMAGCLWESALSTLWHTREQERKRGQPPALTSLLTERYQGLCWAPLTDSLRERTNHLSVALQTRDCLLEGPGNMIAVLLEVAKIERELT